MCPLLIQDMARHHQESLQREVVCRIPYASTYGPGGFWNDSWEDGGFSFPLFDRRGFLYGRPIVTLQKKSAAFGRRLALSLVLLCILMPLFGIAIGISLPILIMGGLLCPLIIVLSIALGRI